VPSCFRYICIIIKTFTFDVDLYTGEGSLHSHTGTIVRRVLKLSLLTSPHLLDWV
jgi:hypothetical protein